MTQNVYETTKRSEKYKRTSLRSLLIATSLGSFYDHKIWGLFVSCCWKRLQHDRYWNPFLREVFYYWGHLKPREDKGDREGIPHTHPIP